MFGCQMVLCLSVCLLSYLHVHVLTVPTRICKSKGELKYRPVMGQRSDSNIVVVHMLVLPSASTHDTLFTTLHHHYSIIAVKLPHHQTRNTKQIT